MDVRNAGWFCDGLVRLFTRVGTATGVLFGVLATLLFSLYCECSFRFIC